MSGTETNIQKKTMSTHANKLLILALGIAIGVIAMLLRDRNDSPDEALAGASAPVPTRAASVPPPPVVPSARPKSSTPAPSSEDLAERATTEQEDLAAFEDEMRRVLRGEASEDEQLAFWQNISTCKRLDALIADL